MAIFEVVWEAEFPAGNASHTNWTFYSDIPEPATLEDAAVILNDLGAHLNDVAVELAPILSTAWDSKRLVLNLVDPVTYSRVMLLTTPITWSGSVPGNTLPPQCSYQISCRGFATGRSVGKKYFNGLPSTTSTAGTVFSTPLENLQAVAELITTPFIGAESGFPYAPGFLRSQDEANLGFVPFPPGTGDAVALIATLRRRKVGRGI